MNRSAEFSPCRTWRYALHRTWNEARTILAVIGLNPSTADETQDDPTIRRILGFAQRWGFGGIVMLNLFAFRATDPRAMKAAADPVGPDNDDAILRETACGQVLCCWGAHGAFLGRADAVRSMLLEDRASARDLMHLGLTKAGHPKHPLYLRGDTEPVVWTPREVDRG